MKSMLHEASSVAKAIEKAWVASGKPGEFTINILESGEKGFLGILTKRPAIVSITYDPKKVSQRQDRAAHQERKTASQRPQERFEDRKPGRQQQAQAQKDTRSHVRDRDQKVRDQKGTARSVQLDVDRGARQLPERQHGPAQNRPERHEKNVAEIDLWTPELVDQIKQWQQELCSLMGITVPFETSINKKILHVIFQSHIFSADDERALYMSLSYLLMQFLKKTHKKKFHNYYIVISTKGSGAHDKRPGNAQE